MIKIIKYALLLALFFIFFLWWLIARPSINFQHDHTQNFQVSASQLKSHVKILSEDFLPRDAAHPENLARAAQFIKTEFERSNQHVAMQYFTVDGQQYANVVSSYGPQSEKTIVIGAHYDAYTTSPGADDNASGVAGLIELNALLKDLALTTRVELVAYALEEPPYFATQNMGSAFHAREFSQASKQIEIMISLEMIGYFSEQKGSQRYPLNALRYLYPDTGNFIAVIDKVSSNKAHSVKKVMQQYMNLPVYSINAPSTLQGIDFSDHRNYWSHGYPAVMVTDTAFFRNHHYHEISDTYLRLDYEKMAQVVYGVFKYIEQIAVKP